MKNAFLYLLIAMFISSCGYSLVKSDNIPFESIKIVKITNETQEPKLQDKLYEALTEEFLKKGITVSDTSLNKLEAAITYFKLNVLSEKKTYAAEYGADIRADFTFTDEKGQTHKLSAYSSPFIESFRVAETNTINPIIASKETAAAAALSNLAQSLISDLIYYGY
ncbi:lipoprotein [Candidatus Magnetoovum chiemensis]|nr:lipoprotein [Candidatus Magnetoovum chiemensis]